MRALIAAFALMAFVTAAALPDSAPAQTPAGNFKPAGKQATKHRKVTKAPLRPAAPAAPAPIYEERPGPKMGM